MGPISTTRRPLGIINIYWNKCYIIFFLTPFYQYFLNFFNQFSFFINIILYSHKFSPSFLHISKWSALISFAKMIYRSYEFFLNYFHLTLIFLSNKKTINLYFKFNFWKCFKYNIKIYIKNMKYVNNLITFISMRNNILVKHHFSIV